MVHGCLKRIHCRNSQQACMNTTGVIILSCLWFCLFYTYVIIVDVWRKEKSILNSNTFQSDVFVNVCFCHLCQDSDWKLFCYNLCWLKNLHSSYWDSLLAEALSFVIPDKIIECLCRLETLCLKWCRDNCG